MVPSVFALLLRCPRLRLLDIVLIAPDGVIKFLILKLVHLLASFLHLFMFVFCFDLRTEQQKEAKVLLR